MQANLLVVDEALLAQVANQILGSSLDIDQDVGLLRFILSCFLSGEFRSLPHEGKMPFPCGQGCSLCDKHVFQHQDSQGSQDITLVSTKPKEGVCCRRQRGIRLGRHSACGCEAEGTGGPVRHGC